MGFWMSEVAMTTGYVIPFDPAELANRFSTPSTEDMLLDAEARENKEEESGENFEESILPLLDRIPKREADLIFLYHIQKKRQADIAAIFNVTQAAISYRLDRGLKRIKFLRSIPQVTEDDIRRDLLEIFKQIDVDILIGMWSTTCQSQVAENLGLTQGRVRHRFFKAVRVLKEAAELNEKFVPYEKIFSAIANKNFNLLREVILPQWSDRGGSSCF
jgi:DNA-directed RNA polymerase specialized sigma24 family protein